MASAAAWAQRLTRATASSTCSSAKPRTRNIAPARSGMLAIVVGPSVMIPVMRRSGWSCCRSALTALKVAITASRAFLPSQGAAVVCAGTPVKVKKRFWASMLMEVTPSWVAGWNWSAASRPSKTPFAARCILPLPPSSAGVPKTVTVPGSSPATHLRPQPRGNGRRADQVVTAAVADIGNTVVFGNQADVRAVPAPADRGGERGWQVGEAPHHVAGELLQEFGGAAGGVELLVIWLGTRVDVERELPDQPGILVHEVHGPPLDILHDFLPLPASWRHLDHRAARPDGGR